jgi:hypothetical protein
MSCVHPFACSLCACYHLSCEQACVWNFWTSCVLNSWMSYEQILPFGRKKVLEVFLFFYCRVTAILQKRAKGFSSFFLLISCCVKNPSHRFCITNQIKINFIIWIYKRRIGRKLHSIHCKDCIFKFVR